MQEAALNSLALALVVAAWVFSYNYAVAQGGLPQLYRQWLGRWLLGEEEEEEAVIDRMRSRWPGKPAWLLWLLRSLGKVAGGCEVCLAFWLATGAALCIWGLEAEAAAAGPLAVLLTHTIFSKIA